MINPLNIDFNPKDHLIVKVENNIEHPDLDDRNYRAIELENNLEVLLIQDRNCDKASAALSVGVGSYEDEPPYFGLAHFCEHLLFMGTEKYPDENEYRQYLQDHQGSSNGYTSTQETNFYFDVGYQYLEGALDRFSQFFISPLFLADCVKREIQTIDSEFKNNLQSDHRRIQRLISTLVNKDHPFSKFPTGNAYTLEELPEAANVDIRTMVMNFYKKYYSSNVMKLVIVGRESLDDLQKLVNAKFSPIKNKFLQSLRYIQPPFLQDSQGILLKTKPVKDTKLLLLVFPIPDPDLLYDVKPISYFTHLVGHEGKGSLLNYLKLREFASEIVTGSYQLSVGYGIFTISILLSEKGLKEYESVILAVFQYLKLITVRPVERIADEIIATEAANYKYRNNVESSKLTSFLASYMQKTDFPRKFILNSNFMKHYSPEPIAEVGKCLQPNNFICVVISKEERGLNLTEKYYGSQYSKNPFPAKFLNILKQAVTPAEMHLPKPNEFIATDFDVVKKAVKAPSLSPSLVYRSDSMLVWHKKDDQFWIPKGKIIVDICKPMLYASARNKAMTVLLISLLDEQLTEYAYDATVASLQYAVDSSVRGIEISVEGFNDKLGILLSVILQKLKAFKVFHDRFRMAKEAAVDHFRGLAAGSPFVLATGFAVTLLNQSKWNFRAVLREFDTINADHVQDFLIETLRSCTIEVLAVGNITNDGIMEIAKKIKHIIDPRPLLDGEKVGPRCFLMRQGSKRHYITINEDAENTNSAIYYYLQVTPLTDLRTSVMIDVLARILAQPIFDRLRTKEQLGYLIHSDIRDILTMRGFSITIQSERATEHLESRIESLLEQLGVVIANLTNEQLTRAIDAAKLEFELKCKNIYEESDAFWKEISTSRYDFSRKRRSIDELDKITKEDLSNLYDKAISPYSSERMLLVIHQKAQFVPRPHTGHLLKSVIYETSLDWDSPLSTADTLDIVDEVKGKPLDAVFPLITKRLTDHGFTEASIKVFNDTIAEQYKYGTGQKINKKFPQGRKIISIAEFQAQLKLDRAILPFEDLWIYEEEYAMSKREVEGGVKEEVRKEEERNERLEKENKEEMEKGKKILEEGRDIIM